MKIKKELLVQPEGELWKMIRVELNEDPSTNQRDLQAIKDWMKKEPHLPDEWEDQPLMTFLRGSSFSLEKCKRKLDMYFTMRTACPEFFTNRDVTSPILKEVLASKVQGPPLPGLTPSGRRVIVIRGIHPNVESHQILEALKLALMVGDIRLIEEKEGVAGDIYILDGAVLGPSVLTKISPSTLKKFIICVQEAYPVKLKEVHVVNTSPVIETFVNIIKPLFKEKLRKRIHVHKNVSDLYKYVPQEMLPIEYGGQVGTMDELQEQWSLKLLEYRDWFAAQDSIKANESLRVIALPILPFYPKHSELLYEQWSLKLLEYRDWFAAQDSIKANESLRPGRPTNYDELFGIDGSFRQLSID